MITAPSGRWLSLRGRCTSAQYAPTTPRSRRRQTHSTRSSRKRGVEVIYDDRAVSAGVMFSDADLLGIPLRVIVSPRNLKDGVIEISARDKSFSEKLNPADVADRIQEKIAELMQFDVE